MEAPAHVAIGIGTLVVEPAVANQLHVERRRIDRTGVHGNELVPGAPGAAIGYKLNIGEREPPIVQKAEYELYNRGKGLDALVFTVVVQFLMGVDAVHRSEEHTS